MVPVICGCGYLAFGRQMGGKRLNVFCPKQARMGFPVEVIDMTKDILTIGLFCAIDHSGSSEGHRKPGPLI
jgi:hypothetical protein